MAAADIVILIVVLLSAVIGLVRGLFREVLSLGTWLAAFLLALFFAPDAAELLSGQITDHSVRLIAAFFIIFLLTLIVGGIVQWLVKQLITTTGLTGTDRFLGFLFGSARGVLVCIVALIAARPFVEESDWWRASRIAPELLAFEQDVLKLFQKGKDVISEVSEQV
ncbi:MAG: CvpA family protein [Pseudomonadales bacterium]